MLLNSFWGRFGMNTNKTQYKVISDPLEWFDMVSDDQYVINNADFSHPNYVQVFYSTNEDMHAGIHGQYDPQLGDYFGDFTDEVKKKGANYITEFISAGPKNYAYKMDNGKTSCTVKGFTLNHISSLVVNFDSIRENVLNDREKKLQVEQLKFTRDKKNWFIKTDIVSKMYGFVYDKRVLLDSFYTLPNGY
ncbi:unnamed protein product [Brachionus calyciflorus]|uniref:Uncharacterized protein n=1 Tax=Brachionus calyciflorus TaxID=104777 RepID=A0A814PSC8_9BILA|nr:unnamed protein product [Brachionus calyciflorus]